VHLRIQHLVPDPTVIRTILRLGIPSSVEQSTRALGIAVMMLLVASFGTIAIASYGIGSRILSFVLIPAMGLSMATSTVVGQNVGAKKNDRAETAARIGMWAGFVGLSVAGALLFVFADPVIRAFVPTEPDVIALGERFMHIMALSFGFFGVQMVMSGALAGAGNTLAAMALSLVSFWILRFPVAWTLAIPFGIGPEGVFWSFPISNVTAAVVAVVWFMRGTWIRRVVDDGDRLTKMVRDEARIEEGTEEG
jgi:putative MATE family efflux protein